MRISVATRYPDRSTLIYVKFRSHWTPTRELEAMNLFRCSMLAQLILGRTAPAVYHVLVELGISPAEAEDMATNPCAGHGLECDHLGRLAFMDLQNRRLLGWTVVLWPFFSTVTPHDRTRSGPQTSAPPDRNRFGGRIPRVDRRCRLDIL